MAGPICSTNPANRNHPLNRGSLAWWLCLPGKMGGPNWYDLFGIYNGTLTNMVTPAFPTGSWMPTARQGGYGQLDMRTYTGSPYVDIPGTAAGPMALTTDWTLSCWFNQQSNPPDTIGSLICRYYANAENAFDLRIETQTLVICATSSVVGPTINNKQWYMVMASTTNGSTSLYLNNTLVGTGAINTLAGTHNVTVGNGYNHSRQFAGFLDDVRIWNRGLSQQENNDYYQEGLKGYPKTLNRISTKSIFPMQRSSTQHYLSLMGVGS